jgi:hypothetical protein
MVEGNNPRSLRSEPLTVHMTRWIRGVERRTFVVAGLATLVAVAASTVAGANLVVVGIIGLVVLVGLVAGIPAFAERGPEADLTALFVLHQEHQRAEFRAAGGGSTIPARWQEIDAWLATTADTEPLRRFRAALLGRRGRLQEAAEMIDAIDPTTADDVFNKLLLQASVRNMLGEAGDLRPVAEGLERVDDPMGCGIFAYQFECARRAAASGVSIDEPVLHAVAAHRSLWPARRAWFLERLRMSAPALAVVWVLVFATVAIVLSAPRP